MKIIPLYLPQYHSILENDKWWGDGFTEWVNVKSATPLFEGHNQPRIPLNNNYYDLSDIEVLKWQCKIARDHGIYGFSFYHYWFNGHLLLQKPMEMLLAHPEIDINYCICWANHDWTDGWKATGKAVNTLIAHNFDDEKDWVSHFYYLLQFFKDPRYIKEDNKPFLTIYIPQIIGKLNKMLSLWNSMAIENGFNGITFLYQCAPAFIDRSWDSSLFKYGIQFNPDYAITVIKNATKGKINSFIIKHSHSIKRFFRIKKGLNITLNSGEVKKYDYDEIWNIILNQTPVAKNLIPSAYVDWDNTPRRQQRGTVHTGVHPQKFKKYFEQLVIKTRDSYQQDKIFVFAWNEWAEGGYLEPDTRFGFGFLDAINEVLNSLGEKE
jgi:hypothetical protein